MKLLLLVAALLFAGCVAETVENGVLEKPSPSASPNSSPQPPDLVVTGEVWPMMAAVNAKVRFDFTVTNEGEGNCSSLYIYADLGDGFNVTRAVRIDCAAECFGKGAQKKFEFEKAYPRWGYREITFRASCRQNETTLENNEFKARLLVYPVG